MDSNISIDSLNTLIAQTTDQIHHDELVGTTIRKATIDVRPEHLHLIPVLEAIASLAVHQREGQVIAVSVIANHNELQFTIADNKTVTDIVMKHVRELVALLKSYSSTAGDQQNLVKLQFVKYAYMHSYPKLMKRFKNRVIQKLEIAFTAAMANYDGSALVAGAREVISALATMYALLLSMKEWSEKITNNKRKGRPNLLPADKVWVGLIGEMDDVAIDIEEVLGNEVKCNDWAVALKGVGADPDKTIALYRWIQKLSSHHRHINALLRYAVSDRGRLELANVDGPDCIHSVVANKPINAAVGTVHCECSLMVNLDERMKQADPPVNYIGVSKLSCAACHAWIQGYNSIHTIKFYTQGTHGRWYKEWAMSPALEDQHMFRIIKDIVERAAKAHADAGPDERRQIALSDSTGAAIWLPQQGRNTVYRSADSRMARELSQTKPEPKNE